MVFIYCFSYYTVLHFTLNNNTFQVNFCNLIILAIFSAQCGGSLFSQPFKQYINSPGYYGLNGYHDHQECTWAIEVCIVTLGVTEVKNLKLANCSPNSD